MDEFYPKGLSNAQNDENGNKNKELLKIVLILEKEVYHLKLELEKLKDANNDLSSSVRASKEEILKKDQTIKNLKFQLQSVTSQRTTFQKNQLHQLPCKPNLFLSKTVENEQENFESTQWPQSSVLPQSDFITKEESNSNGVMQEIFSQNSSGTDCVNFKLVSTDKNSEDFSGCNGLVTSSSIIKNFQNNPSKLKSNHLKIINDNVQLSEKDDPERTNIKLVKKKNSSNSDNNTLKKQKASKKNDEKLYFKDQVDVKLTAKRKKHLLADENIPMKVKRRKTLSKELKTKSETVNEDKSEIIKYNKITKVTTSKKTDEENEAASQNKRYFFRERKEKNYQELHFGTEKLNLKKTMTGNKKTVCSDSKNVQDTNTLALKKSAELSNYSKDSISETKEEKENQVCFEEENQEESCEILNSQMDSEYEEASKLQPEFHTNSCLEAKIKVIETICNAIFPSEESENIEITESSIQDKIEPIDNSVIVTSNPLLDLRTSAVDNIPESYHQEKTEPTENFCLEAQNTSLVFATSLNEITESSTEEKTESTTNPIIDTTNPQGDSENLLNEKIPENSVQKKTESLETSSEILYNLLTSSEIPIINEWSETSTKQTIPTKVNKRRRRPILSDSPSPIIFDYSSKL